MKGLQPISWHQFLHPWFDSWPSQTNNLKIGIHSFPALRSAIKKYCLQ